MFGNVNNRCDSTRRSFDGNRQAKSHNRHNCRTKIAGYSDSTLGPKNQEVQRVWKMAAPFSSSVLAKVHLQPKDEVNKASARTNAVS